MLIEIKYFRAHYSFVEDCLDAYIVGACIHMLGMEDMDSDPPRIPLLCKEDFYTYIHDTAKNILDRYVKINDGKYSQPSMYVATLFLPLSLCRSRKFCQRGPILTFFFVFFSW